MSTTQTTEPNNNGVILPDAARRILDQYQANRRGYARGYDELLAPDGSLRPAWAQLLPELSLLPAEDRDQAVASASRAVHENDLAYRPNDAVGRSRRPWQFDLLPFVLSQADYQHLQDGLVQRAHLLEHIVDDCLGPQSLLAASHLPPALVYGNAGFVPACHGIQETGGRRLNLLAFDVARGLDGNWWVLRNRVAVPPGIGYALEARLIASRSLPDIFDQNRVARVSQFFRVLNDKLSGPADRSLTLLLAPEDDRRYQFEHAILARYLGRGVVTASDLTVRDNQVYLRTVHGLRPVGALLRRVASDQLDPLEMRIDGQSGVPGLLQAMRHRQVSVTNAPCAELVDSPAISSFLPYLSNTLLGEPLKMPSVASWWCGQPRELDYVLKNLHRLNVHRTPSPAVSAPQRLRWHGANLSSRDRDLLRDLIRSAPASFVAIEPMLVSHTPSWNDKGELVASAVTLRLFLVATDNGYMLMPGGLAFAGQPDTDNDLPALLPKERDKDIWVVGSDAHSTGATSLISDTVPIVRSDANLSSRVADNLFWLGRYLQRVEHAARMIRSFLQQTSGESGWTQPHLTLGQLVQLLVHNGYVSSTLQEQSGETRISQIRFGLSANIFDHTGADSLSTILGNIARISDNVKNRFSPDAWRLLERMCDAPRRWHEQPITSTFAAQRELNALIDAISAVNGHMSLNMTRADGWRFLELGNRMERMCQGIRLYSDLTESAALTDNGSLSLLLDITDCGITYRNRYGNVVGFAPVSDLLLLDESHPRSLLSHMEQIREIIERLAEPATSVEAIAPVRIIQELIKLVRAIEPASLDRSNRRQRKRRKVQALCARVEQDADRITALISARHLHHVKPSRMAGAAYRATEQRDGNE